MIKILVILDDKTLILMVNSNISLNNLLLRIAKQRDLDKLPAVRTCRHDLTRLARKDLKRTLESLGINKVENRLYVSIVVPLDPKYNLSPELLIPEEKVQNLSRPKEQKTLVVREEQKALIAQAETFSNKFPLAVFQIILDYASHEPEILKALLGVQQRVDAYYSHQLDRLEMVCLPEEEQKKSLPPSEMHLLSLIPQLPEAKEYPDLLSEQAIKENDIWLLNLALRYGANPSKALMAAAQSGCEAVIPTLLAIPGVDVNFVDVRGWTALQVATKHDYQVIIAALLAVPGISRESVNRLRTRRVSNISEMLNSSRQLAALAPLKVQEVKVSLSATLSASRCEERLIGNESRIEIHLEGSSLQKKLELQDRFKAFFARVCSKKEGARPYADVVVQKGILFISGITLEDLKKLLEAPVPSSGLRIS